MFNNPSSGLNHSLTKVYFKTCGCSTPDPLCWDPKRQGQNDLSHARGFLNPSSGVKDAVHGDGAIITKKTYCKDLLTCIDSLQFSHVSVIQSLFQIFIEVFSPSIQRSWNTGGWTHRQTQTWIASAPITFQAWARSGNGQVKSNCLGHDRLCSSLLGSCFQLEAMFFWVSCCFKQERKLLAMRICQLT